MKTHISTSKTVVLRDATLHYAALATPKDFFGQGNAYQLQVRTEDAEVAAKWSEAGIKVKSFMDLSGNTKPYFYASLKRWEKEGREGVIVCDSEKNIMDSADIAKIGNGSKGHVKLYTYQYEADNGSKGTAAQMVAVMVTELNVWEAEGTLDF